MQLLENKRVGLIKGSAKAIAAGQKAAKTKRDKLLATKINKEYTGLGKTQFRQMVVDAFNKSALTLCLESEQLLFVDALPRCEFIIFERDKTVYRIITALNRKNISIYNKNIGEVYKYKATKNKEIKQMFLDFCDTFDSNVSNLKKISLSTKFCEKIALTFSTRSPSKGKSIGQQHFRMYKTLEEIFPEFEVETADPYRDGGSMIGIIMKRRSKTLNDELVTEAVYNGIVERKKQELSNRLSFTEFRNLSIKQMCLKREMTYEQIGAQFFPPLDFSDVGKIAKGFGVSVRATVPRWSEEKDRFLKENYPDKPQKYIVEYLGREWTTIRDRARKLNIKRDYRDDAWSEEKLKLLKENYSLDIPIQRLSSILHKSKCAIKSKADQLGLKRDIRLWTHEEIRYLKENYTIQPQCVLEGELTRKMGAIRRKANKYGLIRPNNITQSLRSLHSNKHNWSDEELKILHDPGTLQDKIKRLHMGYDSIIEKMISLNITWKTRNKKEM